MKSKTCPHIIVVIAHPWGNIEVDLEEWIRYGPGPRRLVAPVSARCADGHALPLSVIPLRYRNNWLSRLLIRLGIFENPWRRK